MEKEKDSLVVQAGEVIDVSPRSLTIKLELTLPLNVSLQSSGNNVQVKLEGEPLVTA
ncbi:MAG: hypothetical protein AAF975_05355 [Spirochaetota bacterium]